MPTIRRYLVHQVREIEVAANSAVDAVRIATEAFGNKDSAFAPIVGVWGHPIDAPKIIDISAKEV